MMDSMFFGKQHAPAKPVLLVHVVVPVKYMENVSRSRMAFDGSMTLMGDPDDEVETADVKLSGRILMLCRLNDANRRAMKLKLLGNPENPADICFFVESGA